MWILAISSAVAMVGVVYMSIAVVNERRMLQHRQPGVTYAAATFRRDGGWGRADLFTSEGLTFQRKAARHGVVGAALWILALLLYSITALLQARLTS